MAGFLMRYWGPLLGLGFCSVVAPLFIRIFSVGMEPDDFCRSREPEEFPFVGEGVGLSWASSLFPFGLECRYGAPIMRTVFHDLGTPLVVVGLLLIGLAGAGLILKLSSARRQSR